MSHRPRGPNDVAVDAIQSGRRRFEQPGPPAAPDAGDGRTVDEQPPADPGVN